jgi:hypothetical protein
LLGSSCKNGGVVRTTLIVDCSAKEIGPRQLSHRQVHREIYICVQGHLAVGENTYYEEVELGRQNAII